MAEVWQHEGPVTVWELVEALKSERDLAYTTVITITERLRAKGLLGRERVGRSFQYTAVVSGQQYAAGRMSDVLDTATDRHGALLHFAGQLSADEVAELRAALDGPEQQSTDGS